MGRRGEGPPAHRLRERRPAVPQRPQGRPEPSRHAPRTAHAGRQGPTPPAARANPVWTAASYRPPCGAGPRSCARATQLSPGSRAARRPRPRLPGKPDGAGHPAGPGRTRRRTSRHRTRAQPQRGHPLGVTLGKGCRSASTPRSVTGNRAPHRARTGAGPHRSGRRCEQPPGPAAGRPPVPPRPSGLALARPAAARGRPPPARPAGTSAPSPAAHTDAAPRALPPWLPRAGSSGRSQAAQGAGTAGGGGGGRRPAPGRGEARGELPHTCTDPSQLSRNTFRPRAPTPAHRQLTATLAVPVRTPQDTRSTRTPGRTARAGPGTPGGPPPPRPCPRGRGMLPPRLRRAPTNLSGARAAPPPPADFPAPPPAPEPARQGHPFLPPPRREGLPGPLRIPSPRSPPPPRRRSPGGPGPGGDRGARAAQARLARGALRPEASAGGSAHRVRGRGRARGECREVGKGGGRQAGSSAAPGRRRLPAACQEAARGGADGRNRERGEGQGVRPGRGHRGEAVPQPRRGSTAPPQSEPKMAAGAAAAERRRRRRLGREGGRERRAPRAPPPPTRPCPRRPPRPPLGRRSAHARPHAPDGLRARRSLSPRPPPSAAWRARRPVGARSGAPARTALRPPSAPVRTAGRGPSRVPSAARAPASSSSTASSFLPPLPRPHGHQPPPRPPPPPPPPPHMPSAPRACASHNPPRRTVPFRPPRERDGGGPAPRRGRREGCSPGEGRAGARDDSPPRPPRSAPDAGFRARPPGRGGRVEGGPAPLPGWRVDAAAAAR